MKWLWYGTLTVIRRWNTPNVSSWAAMSSSTAASPERVTELGLLTAATETSGPASATAWFRVSAVMPTASIAPVPLVRCCRLLR